MSKLSVTRWKELGFESSCITADAIQVGGVVRRKWLICIRNQRTAKMGARWPDLPAEVVRPMANCLRYTGVPGSAYRRTSSNSGRPPPKANEDCMPAQPGSFIQTDRGVRRLLHDELCNGLGVPKPWVLEYPDGRTVRRTIALHLLEYLTPLLVHANTPIPVPVPKPTRQKTPTIFDCVKVNDFPPFLLETA
jgi:hypothetical protein